MPKKVLGILVVVPVTAWGELLRDRVERRDGFAVVAVAGDGDGALRHLERLEPPPDIVLLDVGTRLALRAAHRLRAHAPAVRLVVIGLDDEPAQVLSWAMVGAIGLVARTSTLEELLAALTDVARGETPCSPAVTGALLRGVRGSNTGMPNDSLPGRLTHREREVARLLAGGLTNKEIARHLQIEPGTVKSHVHSVIRKLGISRRAQVASRLSRRGFPSEWSEPSRPTDAGRETADRSASGSKPKIPCIHDDSDTCHKRRSSKSVPRPSPGIGRCCDEEQGGDVA